MYSSRRGESVRIPNVTGALMRRRAWCAPSEGSQALGRLHVCKDQFCSRVERPAEVGEALPARSPVQQGNTQMLFEHFHLFPYQLRGQIQVVRSGAE